MRHGAKRETCSNEGCNKHVLKRVFRNGRYFRLHLMDAQTLLRKKEFVFDLVQK